MSDQVDDDQKPQHSKFAASGDPQLQALNRDYLQLIALAAQESPATDVYAQLAILEPRLAAEMSKAPEPRLADLADCGLSLFTLSLHNADLWRRIAAAGAQDTLLRRYAAFDEVAEGPKHLLARHSAFLECALFYAWHLARSDRGAGLMFLGMSERTAEIIAALKLWQLRCIAIKHPQLLAPRWSGNACFWPDLVRYLHSGDRQQLDYALLLGAQLLAQELEPSSIERLMGIKQNLFKPPRR